MTTRRLARRISPDGWTARSMPCARASAARSTRKTAGSAPETSSSTEVTGYDASRTIRSMFAPTAAMRRAIAATGAGRSG